MATDPLTASHGAQQVRDAIASGVDPTTLPAHVQQAAHAIENAPNLFGLPIIFNFPAFMIVALVTWILVVGVRESAWANTVMVVIKIGILLFFLALGVKYVRPENWQPFAPNGFNGVWTGASLIFFAYIGFDAVSTAAEESKNPKRDMPFAILMSLLVTSLLYIAVTAVLTGMLPWNQLGTAEPLVTAFTERGLNIGAGIIAFGAVIATTSVLLVFQLGQPRIFYAMARDGLLPGWAASVHKKYRTPHVTTILTGVFVGVFAAVAPIEEVIELTNIGTLFAFLIVAVGILVLRKIEPDRPRPFRTPFVPVVPILAIVSCLWLMLGLPLITWIRFGIWLAVGLAIYFLYGRRRSVLQQQIKDAGR
jgi:APA family basic amino acid/polyamine antiporter